MDLIIPVELFYTILQFFERGEIEKCQLVSKEWDRNIRHDRFTLPLRKIFHMRKKVGGGSWLFQEKNLGRVVHCREDKTNLRLRNAVVEQLTLRLRIKNMKKLKFVLSKVDTELKVIHADFHFGVSVDDCVEEREMLKRKIEVQDWEFFDFKSEQGKRFFSSF